MSASHNRGTESSGGTVAVGGTVTAGAGGAGSGSLMFVFDTKGNVGFVESGGGGGLGGVNWSGGVIIQITNAKSIYQLKGLSTQTGFSVGSPGIGPNAGLEYVIGEGYTGINFIFGAGGGLTPVELHSIAEYAKVQGRSTKEIAEYIRRLILTHQDNCK